VKAVNETSSHKGEAAMNTLSISTFRTGICAAVIALASLSSTSFGQTPKPIAAANVPFGFDFGSQHFAAGRYTVRMDSDHVMTMKGASKSGSAMTMWDDNSKPPAHGKMVFRSYNGRLFLREVWTPGETVHLQCMESKAEKQARRSEVASNHATAPDVELALLETPHQ
jgi:hypothetical protein